MEQQELRKGNLVEYHSRYFKIERLSGDFAKIKSIDNKINLLAKIKKLIPIKLTTEIILSFGLSEKDENIFSKEDNSFAILRENDCLYHFIFHFRLYYVHQIQNLHYVQNGKELQINSKLFPNP